VSFTVSVVFTSLVLSGGCVWLCGCQLCQSLCTEEISCQCRFHSHACAGNCVQGWWGFSPPRWICHILCVDKFLFACSILQNSCYIVLLLFHILEGTFSEHSTCSVCGWCVCQFQKRTGGCGLRCGECSLRLRDFQQADRIVVSGRIQCVMMGMSVVAGWLVTETKKQ